MKIDDPLKKITGPSNGQTMVRAEKNKTSNVNTESSGTVHLSALSSQLQALKEQLSNNDVFNNNKVEEIKLAIANGNFKINSNQVADGLIDTVRDLLHTPAKK